MSLQGYLSWVGGAATLYALTNVANAIWVYARPSSLPRYLHGQEPWALITAAGGGIGQCFAEELLDRGFNVIIHSRTEKHVEKVKTELRRKFPHKGQQIRTLILDADSITRTSVEAALKPFRDLNLTVLVNNAGGSFLFREVETFTPEEIEAIVNLNNRFATILTQVLLPTLSRNQPSLILNVTSLASEGVPWCAIYGGATSYVTSLTRGLNMEMMARNLDIEVKAVTLAPVNVASNPKPIPVSFFVPTAADAVKAMLRKVGGSETVVKATWRMAIRNWMISQMGTRVRERLLAKILTDFKDDAAKNE